MQKCFYKTLFAALLSKELSPCNTQDNSSVSAAAKSWTIAMFCSAVKQENRPCLHEDCNESTAIVELKAGVGVVNASSGVA